LNYTGSEHNYPKINKLRSTSAIIAGVSIQVAGHQTEGYQVTTPVYEGPLDLLLELIERAELDITRLALAQVTDQYLGYLRQLQEHNPAEVSAFLVIASRLVQIKSSALLPRPVIDTGITEIEDDGEALARQLITYKRFKELASFIQDREELGMQTFLRIAPPPKDISTVKLDLEGISLQDLVIAAREIFFNKSTLVSLDKVVTMPRVTIREKIGSILDFLRTGKLTTFNAILSPGTSRIEIVVTFLALLELVKRHIIAAQQSRLFGDIALEPIEEFNESEPFTIEFDGDSNGNNGSNS
jgi:segregation and condensation protein A